LTRGSINAKYESPKILLNTKKGRLELINLIEKFDNPKLIFEATGGYEKPLLLLLQEHKVHATRANPGFVRSFAKAQGLLVKTDRVDALLLARYGEMFHPESTLIIEPEIDEIRDLLRYRSHLRSQLHREKMQLEHSRSKTVSYHDSKAHHKHPDAVRKVHQNHRRTRSRIRTVPPSY
jgi:transposase